MAHSHSYMSQTSNLIPVRGAPWRKCCIPLSVAIKDATFGSERSFLPEYVWVPDTFPYICSSCRRRRRVEDSGGRSWWEDPSLTTCSTSVIKHVLSNPPDFTQAVPKQMVSAAESSEWHTIAESSTSAWFTSSTSDFKRTSALISRSGNGISEANGSCENAQICSLMNSYLISRAPWITSSFQGKYFPLIIAP